MTTKDELYKFLISKHGGEAAVKQEFAKTRLMSVVSGGTTIGDCIEIAKKEDWLPLLLATPVGNLAGKGPVKSTGGRITAAEKNQMQKSILDYLKKHPKSSKTAIAAATGFDGTKVAVQIRGLIVEKKVAKYGKLAKMTYSAK